MCAYTRKHGNRQSLPRPYVQYILSRRSALVLRIRSSMRSSLAQSSHKSRQLSHLHSQLAQLRAHLSDLDSHLRVTSIQAEAIRRLGGLQAGLFMAASQVLGEESIGRHQESST